MKTKSVDGLVLPKIDDIWALADACGTTIPQNELETLGKLAFATMNEELFLRTVALLFAKSGRWPTLGLGKRLEIDF